MFERSHTKLRSWFIEYRIPILIFLASRMLAFSAGYIATIALQSSSPMRNHNLLLDVWANWDSAWYLGIVNNGYSFIPPQFSSTGFMPLYPVLVGAVLPFSGYDVVAGLLVTNAALLGALLVLYRLVIFETGDRPAAQRTLLYLLVFPAAFTLNAIYSESTFLFLTVAAIYATRRHQWGWGLLFAMLASATKLLGIVVWPFILLEWLQVHGWTPGRIGQRQAWLGVLNGLRHDWLVPLLSPIAALGLIIYMAYTQANFGTPFAYFAAQVSWGHAMTTPFVNLLYSLRALAFSDLPAGKFDFLSAINAVCAIAGLGLGIAVWRRLGAAYGVYSLLLVFLPLVTSLDGMVRYLLTIFPVFIELGVLGKRSWLNSTLLISFSLFYGILMSAFMSGHFIL